MSRPGPLARAVIGAPMAGGVSTPALVAAVSDAGGLGFLAAGYLRPADLAGDIDRVRRATTGPFGVNVFVPESRPADLAAVDRFRQALLPQAARWGVTLPDPPEWDTDHFAEKIEVVLAARVPVVSFTFGCPPRAVVDRLHTHGSQVVVTVTDVAEAQLAVAAGADALCVQSSRAGGHRASFTPDVRPDPQPDTAELVGAVRRAVAVPLIAAGGITGPAEIDAVVAAGASAVQVGTALLLTPQAGTHPVHRAALTDPGRAGTVVTRAFSGRPARGLRNRFIDAFDTLAPAAYPQVHHLTRPLRVAAAARGDAEQMALWAGVGHHLARPEPAGQVVTRLAAAVAAATPLRPASH
ncbi:nitroalkane oxidase [Micromonospora matsumotoense]|uniref:Probable nitronate monooxygenase n=1 Tax=Micromonospora matsumotoense TaxID=121616 RepID=A0A1C4XGN2_9ACTN|nr:nitronate monooxygenase [Micromonospora matsumotoense]SCF07492.1 nitroalkane oxidase [Micromonospora matsumotoense]